MKKRRAIAALLAALLCLALILTACGKNDDPGESSDTGAPGTEEPETQEPVTDPDEEPGEPSEPDTEEPDPAETDPEPEGYVNPLTGLPVDHDISGSRPYAVMLNNIRVSTPQSGLNSADIIYEILVEGGITRLMGVYQDFKGVEVIGSVRSSRPYYLDLAQAHDAIYVHAGGSNDAYAALKERNITRIDGVNGTGETFFRDAWRKANMGTEHSLMLDTTLLDDYCAKYKLRTEHEEGYSWNMTFSSDQSYTGDYAETVKVAFAKSGKTTTFSYNADTGLYAVSQYNKAMTDSLTEEQLQVKNIIVLYAEISRIPGDDAGRLEAKLTGTGTGSYIVNGVSMPLTWAKDSYESQFVYTLADGSNPVFSPGVTYICIIPTSGGSVELS